MIVLVSAYERYAIESYALDVLDYLIKPIVFERFLKACNKAKTLFDLNNQALKNCNKVFEALDTEGSKPLDFFFVNADYRLRKIMVKDISYIEGMKDYIKIHLSSQPKPVITRMSMRLMEEKLGCLGFMRVHKSYLVALKKIDYIRQQHVSIASNLIPISENLKSDVLRRVGA
jgi:two-component system, LytTR family, response regulator